MVKKEIYTIALRTTQEALRSYFSDPTGFKDEYFQRRPEGKAIVKKVYDLLEPILIDKEP